MVDFNGKAKVVSAHVVALLQRFPGKNGTVNSSCVRVAKMLGIHPKYLYQIAYGYKQPGATLAKKITTLHRKALTPRTPAKPGVLARFDTTEERDYVKSIFETPAAVGAAVYEAAKQRKADTRE